MTEPVCMPSDAREQCALYAEYLQHTRTLILSVSVSATQQHAELQLGLSSSRDKVTLGCRPSSAIKSTHHNISLQLPARILGTADLSNCLPHADQEQKSSRLQAEPLSASIDSPLSASIDSPPAILKRSWAALKLNSANDESRNTVQLQCCDDDAILLPPGHVQHWKDLPSESWAEMMDFWHCHKPHTEPGGAQPAKGYAAGSKLVAKQGTGLVDEFSFLLAREDCSHLGVTQNGAVPEVTCASCGRSVGIVDEQASGVRLFKACVGLKYQSESLSVSFDPLPTKWLASHLLSAIDVHGTRQFYMTRPAKIDLWVISTDIRYSSTKGSGHPMLALKVLWRQTPSTEDDRNALTSANLRKEEVDWPVCLEIALQSLLVEHWDGLAVPVDGPFRGWKTAVLERFPDT